MFAAFSPAGDLPVRAVSPLSSREHKTMGLYKEYKDSRCARVDSQHRTCTIKFNHRERNIEIYHTVLSQIIMNYAMLKKIVTTEPDVYFKRKIIGISIYLVSSYFSKMFRFIYFDIKLIF